MQHFLTVSIAALLSIGAGVAAGQSPPTGERDAAVVERAQEEAAPRKPRSLKNKPLTCEEKHQLYRESQECFARFRNANSSVSAEAFKHCTEYKQPQCKR